MKTDHDDPIMALEMQIMRLKAERTRLRRRGGQRGRLLFELLSGRSRDDHRRLKPSTTPPRAAPALGI